MTDSRDETPIPFTVADRLDLQAIKSGIEGIVQRAAGWDTASDWVRERRKVELLIWGGLMMVLSWLANFAWWHKK